jgi:hypothetical protein
MLVNQYKDKNIQVFTDQMVLYLSEIKMKKSGCFSAGADSSTLRTKVLCAINPYITQSELKMRDLTIRKLTLDLKKLEGKCNRQSHKYQLLSKEYQEIQLVFNQMHRKECIGLESKKHTGPSMVNNLLPQQDRKARLLMDLMKELANLNKKLGKSADLVKVLQAENKILKATNIEMSNLPDKRPMQAHGVFSGAAAWF